jgi:hypothetical protein
MNDGRAEALPVALGSACRPVVAFMEALTVVAVFVEALTCEYGSPCLREWLGAR